MYASLLTPNPYACLPTFIPLAIVARTSGDAQAFRNCKGLSEYPLKRILNFKGLSVRPSIGYPFETRRFRGDPFRISLRCDWIAVSVFVTASDEHDKIDEPPKPKSAKSEKF